MPIDRKYAQQKNQLIFNMFNFVETEKSGWKSPLYNVNARLRAMLGISMRLVERLKGDFREDQKRLAEQIKKANEEELRKQKG